MTWTDEQITFLRTHWGQLKAYQIGDQIGVTRNAVIGMARRQGLERLKQAAANPEAAHERKLQRDRRYKKRIRWGRLNQDPVLQTLRGALSGGGKPRVVQITLANNRGESPGPVSLTAEIGAAGVTRYDRAKKLVLGSPQAADTGREPSKLECHVMRSTVTFWALTREKCHWPLDEGLFCGDIVVMNKLYCSHHLEKAYRRRY